MIAVSASFDGGRFGDALNELRKKLGDHMLEAAEVTAEYAKELSPVDTGTNKRSICMDAYIDSQIVQSSGDAQLDRADNLAGLTNGFRVYTVSGYGGYLEVGTKKMPAQPYLYPAFERAMRHLENTLEGSV